MSHQRGTKPTVLFVCTGNAGRSQMAEAMFRDRYGDRFEVRSAGVDPWPHLHPTAERLMGEAGLSLAGHHPKHVRRFVDEPIDVAVTIGDRAEAETPELRTQTRRIHWPITDPADADGTPDAETVFRRTREAISDRLPALVSDLASVARSSWSGLQPATSTALFRTQGLLEARGGPPAFRPGRDLPLIAEAGFRTIELCCYVDVDFAWTDRAALRDLRRVAGDLGVAVHSLHPPELGFARGDPDGWRSGIDVLERFVDLAQELGSAGVVFHLFPSAWIDAPGALSDLLGRLEALVLKTPITLCLETLQDHESNAALVELLPQTSRSAFGLVIDTGHSHIAGDLDGAAQRFGRRVKGLHIHDNDASGDQHLPIGRGTIDWARFASDLRAAGYEGPLLLETNGPRTAEELPALLRESATALDRIAAALRGPASA